MREKQVGWDHERQVFTCAGGRITAEELENRKSLPAAAEVVDTVLRSADFLFPEEAVVLAALAENDHA